MAKLKLGESNESEVKKSYRTLKILIKSAEGVAIDRLLPSTNDSKTVSLADDLNRIDKYIVNYNSSYAISPVAIARRLVGRSAHSSSARQILDNIQDVIRFLTKTTHQRGQYKILSPLAFNPDLTAIPELKTAGNFKGTWKIDFKWVSTLTDSSSTFDCHSAGSPFLVGSIATLLEAVGFSYQALFTWWRDHHLDGRFPETDVWNDMRALARKMVFLLEECKDDSEGEQDELEQTVLEECIATGQNIAIKIVEIVDRYPSEVESVRPSFEIFVPIIFVLFKCLKSARPGILSTIGQTLHNLQSLVTTLESHMTMHEHSAISEQENSTLLPYDTSGNSLELETSVAKIGDVVSDKRITVERTQEAVLPFSMQDLKRLQLEKVELEQDYLGTLGDGSSAIVRRYNSLDRSQQYAVKIFRIDPASFNEQRHWNRIIREAEFWIKAKHKNINKLIGFCSFDGSTYPGLVMDVCEDNLSRLCSVSVLSDEQKLELMHDVASGLAYLHGQRNVHGDLRPPNILVKKSFIPNRRIAVLTDFGFADTMEESFNRISMRTDGQRAPEAYRPPEFFKSRRTRGLMLSTEADIYAFGCVFAEIVHRSIPYEDVTKPMQKLKKDAVYPVESQKILNTKHWTLLCQVWDARPDKRPIALQVVDILEQFIIDSRSLPVS